MANEVPQQFLIIIHELMSDHTPVVYPLSTADLMVMMSALLGACALGDAPIEARDALFSLARLMSDWIEARHPDSEPYLAYLFGLTAFTSAFRGE